MSFFGASKASSVLRMCKDNESRAQRQTKTKFSDLTEPRRLLSYGKIVKAERSGKRKRSFRKVSFLKRKPGGCGIFFPGKKKKRKHYFFLFYEAKNERSKKILRFPRKKIALFANVVAGGSVGLGIKIRGACCGVLRG